MRTMEVTQATGSLEAYIREAQAGPIVLTRRGRPVAALVPIQGMDLEQLTLATNEQFLALIERARTRQKAEGGLSIDEVRRELGVEREAG